MFLFWQRLERSRWVLAAAVLLLALVQFLPIRRVPTPDADGVFYSSIALSIAGGGAGVPSMFEHAPVRVDHQKFYGPVYFEATGWVIRTFGLSTASSRTVSTAGVMLLAIAGGCAAWWWTGHPVRGLVATTVLLLAPEVSAGNVAATMHALAVGLEVLALAGVAALARWPNRWWPSLLTGLGLAGAALTTPRAFPCLVAFAIAGAWTSARLGRLRRAWLVGLGLAVVALATWAVAASGDGVGWLRLMWTVLTREDRDVALLATAARNWAPSGGALVTPLAAVAGILMAAWGLDRHRPGGDETSATLTFAIRWIWITVVLSLVTMSHVGAFRIYWALPALALVLAVPYDRFGLSRPAALLVLVLVGADAGVGLVRWMRIAATWDRRDPALLESFVRTYVPPGSAVVGPAAFYLVSVERAGARYFHWRASSHADWARWALGETTADRPRTRWRGRYLIWPTGRPMPGAYRCVGGIPLARFTAPPDYLDVLGLFGETEDTGFVSSDLFVLPPGCPSGFDPTGEGGTASRR